MSEEFDKEAEREKLRQQLAAEEEEREATQRMSELLLKGATMTNMHCDECGDPVFRYQGQEFCPTCQRPVGDAGDETADPDRADDATGGDAPDGPPAHEDTPDDGGGPDPSAVTGSAAGPDDGDGPARSTPEAAPVDGGSPSGPTGVDAAGSTRTGAGDSTGTPAGTGEPVAAGDASAESSPALESPGSDATPGETRGSPASDDLEAARASLVRTLTALARRAEAADDVGRARELLAAAGEAAAAIEAVESARR